MSAHVDHGEPKPFCADCRPDTPEEELCGYCLLDLAGNRAGDAFVKIATASGDWDGDPDGYMEVNLGNLGYLVIEALITPSRCPEELVKALEYARFTRGPGIANLTDEERRARVDVAIDKAVEHCPDDLGHVPGPGRPI